MLEGDKQKKWENLTDIWDYVWNREEFYQYVKGEVEKFLKETK